MSNRINKPKKTALDLVRKLSDEKGIALNYMTDTEAEEYLLYRNNYLRTAAYRKNYEKYKGGPKEGKYINLDFAYLCELSTIDMHLRSIIIRMSADIEHAIKVLLVREVETNNLEDGYSIVDEAFAEYKYFSKNIMQKADSPNCKGLINNSFTFASVFERKGNRYWLNQRISDIDCAIWTFLEICSFGDLIKFYNFYYDKYFMLPRIEEGILNAVKSIRNSCAHNNCLFFDLRTKDTAPSQTILNYAASLSTAGRSLRQNRLSVRPIYELVCLLYVYQECVSDKVKGHRMRELRTLFHERLVEKKGFFVKNEHITSSYKFLVEIIDNLQ